MTLEEANKELDTIISGINKIPFISYAAIVIDSESDNNEDYLIEYGTIISDKFDNTSKKDEQIIKNNYSNINKALNINFPIKKYIPRFSRGINHLSCKFPDKDIRKHKKIKGGISISNLVEGRDSGTLGGLFKLDKDSSIYGISNYHVTRGHKPQNKTIVHPSTADADKTGENHEIIGEIAWEQYMKLDASIIKLQGPTKSNQNYFESGDRINGKSITGINKPVLNSFVNKCGRSSGYTSKQIISTRAVINIIDKGVFTFPNVIMTEEMACHGDSGSLVLNNKREAVGLLIANDQEAQRSFFVDINNIFHAVNGNPISKKKPPFKLNHFI